MAKPFVSRAPHPPPTSASGLLRSSSGSIPDPAPAVTAEVASSALGAQKDEARPRLSSERPFAATAAPTTAVATAAAPTTSADETKPPSATPPVAPSSIHLDAQPDIRAMVEAAVAGVRDDIRGLHMELLRHVHSCMAALLHGPGSEGRDEKLCIPSEITIYQFTFCYACVQCFIVQADAYATIRDATSDREGAVQPGELVKIGEGSPKQTLPCVSGRLTACWTSHQSSPPPIRRGWPQGSRHWRRGFSGCKQRG